MAFRKLLLPMPDSSDVLVAYMHGISFVRIINRSCHRQGFGLPERFGLARAELEFRKADFQVPLLVSCSASF